jgi:hypothetical protein
LDGLFFHLRFLRHQIQFQLYSTWGDDTAAGVKLKTYGRNLGGNLRFLAVFAGIRGAVGEVPCPRPISLGLGNGPVLEPEINHINSTETAQNARSLLSALRINALQQFFLG